MDKKCVMVIDSELPTGLIVNTSAVLALTLGKKIDGIIGPDVKDGDGKYHTGITTTPIPILKSDSQKIQDIRNILYHEEFSDLLVVDFSNAAQTTKNYEEYTDKISQFLFGDLKYLGIALYGDKKKVNKLTGSLGLLR